MKVDIDPILLGKIERATNTSAEFREALQAVSRRKQEIETAQFNIREAYRRFHKERDELQKKLESIQAECSRRFTTHHGDPSGNNDSHYECLICGTTSSARLS